MSTTTAHPGLSARNRSVRRLGRRIAGLLLTGGLATGLTLAGTTSSASAASPGVFNYTQCVPSSQSIVQDIESYQSYAGEYVVLQGALVHTVTAATSYSQWAVGTGATAHTAISWTNVPRGQYNVFYRWASWDSARGEYAYSGWIQVTGAGLNTYGTPVSPGSYLFIGGTSGHCTI
jgi:hypothetical protein